MSSNLLPGQGPPLRKVIILAVKAHLPFTKTHTHTQLRHAHTYTQQTHTDLLAISQLQLPEKDYWTHPACSLTLVLVQHIFGQNDLTVHF